MDEDFSLGHMVWKRLDERASQNAQAHQRNLEAKNKITDIIIPAVSRGTKVNVAVLAALREIYTVIEDGDEEQSQTLGELEEVRGLLEITTTMLEKAGLDIDNIQTIARNDKLWLGNHLPTMKVALNVFNLAPQEHDVSLFEQALDSLEKERFEDIAHAVKRSGEKRSNVNE